MTDQQPEAETVIASETIYAGKLLTFQRDQVQLASGHTTTREVVIHPGAVAVVPLLPNGRVVMVRQYRHAAGRSLLEIPAGTLDQPGESLAAAAARELQEETGYRATQWQELVAVYTAPGFCTEKITIFLATGLTHGDRQLMEDEAITLEEIALSDIPTLVAQGELADAKTLTGLLLAQLVATA